MDNSRYYRRAGFAKKKVGSRYNRVSRGGISGYGSYHASKGKSYYNKYRKYRAASKGSAFSPPDSIGSKIGGWIGHGAQSLLKMITGFGDYSIEQNSLMNGGMSPPEIVNSVRTGGVILRHREYIQDIVASTSFVNQTFDIQPGLQSVFPWLSTVASNFELYRMRGLIFEFKSTSSSAVISTQNNLALGTVMMATQYNSLNPGFTSEIQMLNHEFANSGTPSVSICHPVECKKSLLPASELYIRTGAVPSGGDIRLFDLGQFNIATQGMPSATGTIGQLWATYEIELYQQCYNDADVVGTAQYNSQAATSSHLLGFGTATKLFDNIGLEVNLAGLNGGIIVFTEPKLVGIYMITVRHVFSATGSCNQVPTLNTSANITVGQNWSNTSTNNGTVSGGNANVTAETTVVWQWIIQFSDTPIVSLSYISPSSSTLTNTVAETDIYISEMDGQFPIVV